MIVTAGKDKGRQEKIEKVFPKGRKVLVVGVNQYKKHVKPQGDRQGDIVTLTRALDIAKVALVCPSCKAATRVGYMTEGDKKVRICRKCKAVIS